MSEVRGSNSWRDELASLVSDSGIRYAAADPIEVPTASFDSQASDFGSGELEQSESFKDQIKGFAIAWGEILVDLGRGCKDIVEQNILTKDSYIVRKLQKPCAKASEKLRYLNEFLPEDRDPAHAWPVIFFVSILALTGILLLLHIGLCLMTFERSKLFGYAVVQVVCDNFIKVYAFVVQ